MDFNAIVNRVIKVAMLNVPTYEEIENDQSLNQQALIVVIAVSILAGIGAVLSALFSPVTVGAAIVGAVWAVIWGVLGYYVWSYLTWWIGTSLFQGQADQGEVLRTLGFAQGPRALSVFSFIPCVGAILSLVGGIWALVCGFIAVRESLDLDNGKALITIIIGWIIIMVVGIIVGGILGIGGLALGGLLGS